MKVPVIVQRDAPAAARFVAHEIAALVRARLVEGRPCVLGLATGSTPIAVYRELVRQHRDEGLSFRAVTTFNLDEYYPCHPDEPHSYVRYLREHLVDHVDLDPNRVFIPDGTIPRAHLPAACAAYEAAIRAAGGIDLQLVGIGRTGHLGFNEPGSSEFSRTRLVDLHATTLADNRALPDHGDLPSQAITMGVGTILEARRVILLACGEHKRAVVRAALTGPVSTAVTASFLQHHPNALTVLDEAAAGSLPLATPRSARALAIE